jgi:hypothetical protein
VNAACRSLRWAAQQRYRRLMLHHLRCLRLITGGRPVPLRYWLLVQSTLRSVLTIEDPLFPPYASLKSIGAALEVADLKELLHDDLLGAWSIDHVTVMLLWQRLIQDQPRTIVECGAGLSTIVLAKYAELCRLQHLGRTTLYSLEQDGEVKHAVERRLAELELDGSVHILHVPVAKHGGYDLDPPRLIEQLGGQQVDWILIDGPSGPAGCRDRTLPVLAPFCRPGARWFLDDALRAGELGVLRRWSGMPGIEVDGIHPVGKGLGTGSVKRPQDLSRQGHVRRVLLP